MTAVSKYNPTKPADQIKREKAIRESLIKAGYDKHIANAVLGYKPEDIPFIYRCDPMTTNGGSLISELWMGSSDAIHNLDGLWNDQIQEVLVQWWGHTPVEDGVEGEKEVERLEVHPVEGGSFVRIDFKGVSEMGAFDGTIKSISYYIPSGTFRPMGESRERNQYSSHHFQPPTEGGSEHWQVNLGRSSFSGTTILNAFSQMLSFHLGEITPMKEDYGSAFRFSPLPEVETTELIASGEPEQLYHLLLNEADEQRAVVIELLLPDVIVLMSKLAPIVLEALAAGRWHHETMQMATDGVLHHPEKIALMGKKLSELTREQRWSLVNIVVSCIRDGSFKAWIQKMTNEDQIQFVNDTATRNGYHLLNWFMRVAPASANLHQWVADATKVVDAFAAGEKLEEDTSVAEYRRVFDGMCTSFVERFVEYLAQLHFGNALE